MAIASNQKTKVAVPRPGHWHFAWKPWLAHLRHALPGLAVGLVIAILLHLPVVQNLLPIRAGNDMAMDAMIRLNADLRRIPRPDDVVPFTLLDIDERTYRDWGEPLFVPRDRLLQLICWAMQGQPSAIIVDVDLTTPGGDSGSLSDKDQRLADLLGKRNLAVCGVPSAASGADVPIILPRSFESQLDAASEQCEDQRPSFLEQPSAEPPNLYWAAVRYTREYDQVVRSWRLWEAGCRAGKPAVAPSVQLLTAALLRRHKYGPLTAWLSQQQPADCASCGRAAQAEGGGFELGEQPGEFTIKPMRAEDPESYLSQRIVYQIPWDPAGMRPPIRVGPTELLHRLPARDVASSKPRTPQIVAGRVVVIGGSYNEGRDYHMTPLGEMPGALVLINSIHSLIQYRQLKPPGRWLEWFLIVIEILVMLYAFERWHHLPATFLAGLVMVLGASSLSFAMFKSGAWVNFSLPLIAVYVHNYIEAFKEASKSRKKHP